MSYFLAKTEPGTYSIGDLEKEGITTWNGVRNPAAVQALKKMLPGDKVYIYHSGEEKAIVGLAEVVGNSRADESDARSWLVDFKHIKTFSEPRVTLKHIKESDLFTDFALVKQGRLSVMPVPQEFVEWLKKQNMAV